MTPSWLFFDDAPDKGEDNNFPISIAIGPVTENQWHVGVLHKRKDQPFTFLHLAFHNVLRNDSPKPSFARIKLDLPVERADQVAAQCRRIWKKNEQKGIPYAFSFTETSFMRTGELLLGKTEYGLTCATFVLALFSIVGIQLLNPAEWPRRESDREWQNGIIASLKSSKDRIETKAKIFRRQTGKESTVETYERKASALALHINNIEGLIGCVRIRPQEVAGAASTKEIPASFQYAELASQKIEKAFQERI